MSSVPRVTVTGALLRLEPLVYVLPRIGARVWLILSPLGWANTPGLRAAAVGFMVYDVALAVHLHRSKGPALWVRWLLDTGDVTVWALLCPPAEPYSAAVVVAVPLLVFITVRRGIVMGAAAGAGIALVTSAGRLAIGARPFTGDTLLYESVGIALGAIVLRLLRAEAGRQRDLAETLAQADRVAAALAGRNDVLTGVGADAIDDLQTSIMRLTAAKVDAAATLRAAVGGHKQELGEETREGAVYLRDALDTYAAEVRAHEPSVARHVFFDVTGKDGVRVLSRDQAGQLKAALAGAGVTGFVQVRVPGYRIGGAIVVQAGQERFTLAATTPTRFRLPVGPLATAGLGLYILTLSNSNYTAVPLRLTIPLAAVVLGYAGAGLALIRRFGQRTESWLSVGALVPFALVALLTARASASTGIPRLTLLGPLAGLALLLGTVVQPRSAVVAAWCGLGLAAAAVVWSAPRLSDRFIAAELIWPLIAFIGAHLTARAIGRLSQDLSAQLTEERRAEALSVRHRAARRELDFLLAVLSQGQALCISAEPGAIRSEVTSELIGLRRLINSLAATLA